MESLVRALELYGLQIVFAGVLLDQGWCDLFKSFDWLLGVSLDGPENVNDLYRYEIRRLRDRLLRGEFPKDTYYDRVVTLRNKYAVLALKPLQFLE